MKKAKKGKKKGKKQHKKKYKSEGGDNWQAARAEYEATAEA